MCRSYTEDSTETRRQAHRATRVAADYKIHHAGGDSGRRAAGRTARNSPWSVHVHRRAIVRVLSREAPGQFVGVGLTDEMRTRVEQALNCRRRTHRRAVGAQPIGAAESRPMARDVVDVLDSKGESPKRPVRRASQLNVCMAAERSEPIVGNDLVHRLSNADKEK
jgi:hypothetical protein